MELYAKTVALLHYELGWCTYLIRVHLPERWSSKPRYVAETTCCNPPPFTSGPSPHCFHGDSHNWSLKIAHKTPQMIQNISFLSIYHPHPSLSSLSFSLFICLVLLCCCCFLLANMANKWQSFSLLQNSDSKHWRMEQREKTKKMMLHNWETLNSEYRSYLYDFIRA